MSNMPNSQRIRWPLQLRRCNCVNSLNSCTALQPQLASSVHESLCSPCILYAFCMKNTCARTGFTCCQVDIATGMMGNLRIFEQIGRRVNCYPWPLYSCRCQLAHACSSQGSRAKKLAWTIHPLSGGCQGNGGSDIDFHSILPAGFVRFTI